jgi:hypothetical protein
MSESSYLKHIRNLNDKHFIKLMDYGYTMKQILSKVNNLNTDIDIINQLIKDLQQQLKIISPELKSDIVSQIKYLGIEKNKVKNQINDELFLIESVDGYRAKITRIGPDKMFGNSGFVEYVIKNVIYNSEFINKFNKNLVEII